MNRPTKRIAREVNPQVALAPDSQLVSMLHTACAELEQYDSQNYLLRYVEKLSEGRYTLSTDRTIELHFLERYDNPKFVINARRCIELYVTDLLSEVKRCDEEAYKLPKN